MSYDVLQLGRAETPTGDEIPGRVGDDVQPCGRVEVMRYGILAVRPLYGANARAVDVLMNGATESHCVGLVIVARHPEIRSVLELLLTNEERPQMFCEIGDTVEFIKAVVPTTWEGVPTLAISVGDLYRARELIGSGWNLTRIAGEGPTEIRLLDSQMREYVRIVESDRPRGF